MKRKDAVQIIEDVLRGAYDYPALTILDKLENAGMLPPKVEMKQTPEEIEKYGLVYPDGYNWISKWEDEK